MMSGTEQAKWEKLNVIQLKGALAGRGLAGAGPKDELVARLKEYELKRKCIIFFIFHIMKHFQN